MIVIEIVHLKEIGPQSEIKSFNRNVNKTLKGRLDKYLLNNAA